MKRDEIFQSKFMKAAELDGRPVTLTIKSAPYEVLKNPEGKEQGKTVLYFHRTKKALPLNMVNWDSVAEICGGDTDTWPGHQIELYPTKTEMGGKLVDCIRIRRPQGELPLAANAKPKPQPAPVPEAPPIEAYADVAFDDDLPEAFR
jgi:hypothetical protein